jgi:hypothetical protein
MYAWVKNNLKQVTLVAVVSGATGLVLGPGFIWEWRSSQVEGANLSIETLRAVTEITSEIVTKLDESHRLERAIGILLNCDDSLAGYSREAVLPQVQERFGVVTGDLHRIEQRLAELERRPQRQFSVEMPRPMPPSGFRITGAEAPEITANTEACPRELLF